MDKTTMLAGPMAQNTLTSMRMGEVRTHIAWWHKDGMPQSELRGEVMAWGMPRMIERGGGHGGGL